MDTSLLGQPWGQAASLPTAPVPQALGKEVGGGALTRRGLLSPPWGPLTNTALCLEDGGLVLSTPASAASAPRVRAGAGPQAHWQAGGRRAHASPACVPDTHLWPVPPAS